MSRIKPITKLIVPLAGLGTRFLPSSFATPKELTHLVDKPVLQYIVEEAYDSGITEIIFIINSQKEAIRKYFSSREQDMYTKKAFQNKSNIPEDFQNLRDITKKIKFTYVKKDSTWGDGHSILFAKPHIGNEESFAVTMGDLLYFGKQPFIKQLIQVYNKKNSAVISVQKGTDESIPNNGVIGIKKTTGKLHLVEKIVEKPKLTEAPSRIIMTGKYILTSGIFGHLEKLVKNRDKGEVKLANALRDYAGENELYAYECEGTICDTGNRLDFLKATLALGLRHETLGKPFKKNITSLKL